jgi:hypothetical protein
MPNKRRSDDSGWSEESHLDALELQIEEIVFLHAQEDVEHDADQLGHTGHRVFAIRFDRLLRERTHRQTIR